MSCNVYGNTSISAFGAILGLLITPTIVDFDGEIISINSDSNTFGMKTLISVRILKFGFHLQRDQRHLWDNFHGDGLRGCGILEGPAVDHFHNGIPHLSQ